MDFGIQDKPHCALRLRAAKPGQKQAEACVKVARNETCVGYFAMIEASVSTALVTSLIPNVNSTAYEPDGPGVLLRGTLVRADLEISPC